MGDCDVLTCNRTITIIIDQPSWGGLCALFAVLSCHCAEVLNGWPLSSVRHLHEHVRYLFKALLVAAATFLFV